MTVAGAAKHGGRCCSEIRAFKKIQALIKTATFRLLEELVRTSHRRMLGHSSTQHERPGDMHPAFRGPSVTPRASTSNHRRAAGSHMGFVSGAEEINLEAGFWQDETIKRDCDGRSAEIQAEFGIEQLRLVLRIWFPLTRRSAVREVDPLLPHRMVARHRTWS